MEHLLVIDNISCRYDDNLVVEDLSLRVCPGALVCLVGPSGCGKTTVLRTVAGFEAINSGTITLDSKEVSRRGFLMPPEKRGVGMVFQDYALFPHLSVADNISFGLQRVGRKARRLRVDKLLELVGMEGTAKRYPHELSGGQQQRVALARALAPEPPLLLMDEPFSNLDVDLRARLVRDVRDILKSQGTAALFVTHDQHEAFAMGERVGVMNEGRIVQFDTPFNLYHEPANRFVAEFIGEGRFVAGRMADPDSIDTSMGTIKGNRAYNWPRGCRVDMLLRPDDVRVSASGGTAAVVTGRAFRGAETMYTLQLPGGEEVLSLMPSHDDFMVGDQVTMQIHADHLVLFQAQGEAR
ncbi:MAG: ABC transporter ATP-binding protein [bacterium]